MTEQENQAEINTQAIRYEVIPGGLIENQRLGVFDAAPGTGTVTPAFNLPLA